MAKSKNDELVAAYDAYVDEAVAVIRQGTGAIDAVTARGLDRLAEVIEGGEDPLPRYRELKQRLAVEVERVDLFRLREIGQRMKERLIPEVEVPMTAAQEAERGRLLEATRRGLKRPWYKRVPSAEDVLKGVPSLRHSCLLKRTRRPASVFGTGGGVGWNPNGGALVAEAEEEGSDDV